ncbi:MAG: TetR/AcrR family transcriptional regulator [Paracoccaceae bacterium]|nr:MAG: TetR/AcrR family transcriptional regulator [Paracoccaceae bacterium]
MQVERRSNEVRSRETQTALLDAARALFVELGFASSSTPMIAQRAGTTRGALYHHYPDKKAVLRAVLEREAERVAEAISASEAGIGELSPLDALLRGTEAYLKAMQVAGRTRLLLVDGPAVLGEAEMAEIDRRYARASLELGLSDLMGHGKVDQPTLTALSDLLSSLFDRAALAVSEGAPATSYRAAIDQVLSGLASRSRD